MKENKRAIGAEPLKKACARAGLKITPQRIAVYEELSKSHDHPSAYAVFKRVRKTHPHISFDTVYRTLLSFLDLGIAKLVISYDDRKRFEPDIRDHHHCVCVRCQKIVDFCDDRLDAIPVPQGVAGRFRVLAKKIVLEGICPECGKARPAASKVYSRR